MYDSSSIFSPFHEMTVRANKMFTKNIVDKMKNWQSYVNLHILLKDSYLLKSDMTIITLILES